MKNDNINKTPVAIVGMGCLFARSNGLKPYWRLLFQGKDAITDIPEGTHWSPEDYFDSDPKKPDHVYCSRGGFLSSIDFDPTEFGIPPNVLESTDTSQLLALIAAKMALKDAGYLDKDTFDRSRTSVILGATGTQELAIPLGARLGHPHWRRALSQAGVSPDTAEDVIRRISDSYIPWHETSFPGLLGNVIAGRVCNRLDLGGTNCVVDAACASSLSAVHLSLMELENRRSDMVLTGGVDLLNDIFMHMCFSRTGVLSPTQDIRPFSKKADGTLLGEGVGILALKRLSDAEQDRDTIYAVIKGMGTSSDGRSQSIYAPRKEGQVSALREAYQRAGISPATVGHIEAHGTGTRVGDEVEFHALHTVFDDAEAHPRRCALGSVKSMIGHAKAAAGSAGLIKTALALHHKVLPPTLKANKPDPKLGIDDSPFYLNPTARPWFSASEYPRRAGVSAFGFGGSNFHIVLEEYRGKKTVTAWDGSAEILAFSDDTLEALSEKVGALVSAVSKNPSEDMLAYRASASRKRFSAQASHRLLMVIDLNALDLNDILQRLKDTHTALCTKNFPAIEKISHAYYGNGKKPGDLAFLFPGQGSQYINMGRELICMFPEAFDFMERADKIFQKENNGKSLTGFIYPTPAAGLKEKRRQEGDLRRTDIAQPAIGGLSMAMVRILERFGVQPDACCGHSYGELTALCAAQWIEDEALLSLSIARGRCMADAGKQNGNDSGTMIVVLGPLNELAEKLKNADIPVVLANRNSPSQGVLSGPGAAIKHAEALCAEWGFSTGRLPVSAAFHSDIMAHARKPFSDLLDRTPIAPGDRNVYTNISGKAYAKDSLQVKKLLRDQLVSPVNFLENVNNLYKDGVRTFVEVGPRAILTGLVRESLTEDDTTALSMNGSNGKETAVVSLAVLLCRLGAMGYPLSLDDWEAPAEKPAHMRMRIPVSGANALPKPTETPVSESGAGNDKPKASMIKPKAEHTTTVPPTPPPNIIIQREGLSTMSSKHMPDAVTRALRVAEQGLKSMQALQLQTAETHRKFLETQSEAAKALQDMIANTRRLSSLGTDELSPAFSETAADAGARQNAINTVPDVQQSVESSQASSTPTPETVSKPETDHLSATMLAVVSRLTGYPEEMLGLDMDIESDLGIDSIKRVEILSAMEEEIPELPTVSPEVMGGLKTLGQIVDHLTASRSVDASAGDAPPPVMEQSSTAVTPDNRVKDTLISTVGRLTGYPEEMLGLDMDIESDLGIDSIKRVEILSAMEEKIPGLPTVSPEMMGSLKTLGQIVEYLSSATLNDLSAPAAPVVEKIVAHADPGAARIKNALLATVSRLTGYPEEMLGLDMDIESDLGIDSIKRVEILSAMEEEIPELPAVSPEMMGSLKTLGLIISHLSGNTPEDDAAVTTPTPETPSFKDEPAGTVDRYIISPVSSPEKDSYTNPLHLNGTVYITDDETGLSNAVAEAFRKNGVQSSLVPWDTAADIREGRFSFADACGLLLIPNPGLLSDDGSDSNDLSLLKDAFSFARHAGPSLLSAAEEGNALLATVTRLDGAFGFSGNAVSGPLSGGLAGLLKTAALEWETVKCRALDIAPSWTDLDRIAERIVFELMDADSNDAVEIGLDKDTRTTLMLSASPSSDTETSALNLKPDDVVVVSGGARGITAAAALSLARTARPALVLLGRSSKPFPEPAWLHGLKTQQEIKAAIIENEFKDKKATPKSVEAAYKRLMANREMTANIEKLQDLGCRVRYISIDVRNHSDVSRTLETIRNELGPIKGIIHGAGVLEDKLILDKSDAQVERVLDTKIMGLQSLLRSTETDPVSFVVLFSSVAARFGNIGQADYAMANEALNKIAACHAVMKPDRKTIAINWGPWDGGMVTDSLKREFSRKQIDLIPIEKGAQYLLKEMTTDRTLSEVVIGAPLREEAPGLSEDSATEAGTSLKPSGTDSLREMLNRDISLEEFPVLASHQLDGTPVVPFALLAEWIGHGALHDNPGLLIQSVEDMRLLKGIRMDVDKKEIRLLAGRAKKKGSAYEVDVEIRNSIRDAKEVLHSKARALLTDRLPSPPAYDIGRIALFPAYEKSIEEVYENILFHGHTLQGIQKIIGLSDKGMAAEVSPAPSPESWITRPMRSRWIADPLILDSAFQMACVWCYENRGMVSLPSFVASFRQYCRIFPNTPVTTILEVTDVTERKMVGDVTILDSDQTVAAELKGYEAIMDTNLFKAFKPELAKSA